MRIIQWATLLACLPLSLMGQRAASWGIEVYPNYSRGRLVAAEQLTAREIRALDSLEQSSPAWSAGLFTSWRVEKFGFEIGLGYMRAGHRTIRQNVLPGDPDVGLGEQRRDIFEGHYIEVPMQLSFYQRLGDRDEFLFSMGAGLNYNVANVAVLRYYNGDAPEQRTSQGRENFRPVNYAFQAGIGWERTFGERMSLLVQPNFRLWLGGLRTDMPVVNRNLYSVGLRLGLRWHYGPAIF